MLPARTPGRIERPVYASLTLAVLVAMVGLFVFGERLPAPIVPPAVALIASALLVGYAARVEPTDNVLRDVDWKTLMFLASIFCLVQAIVKTGLLQLMALRLYDLFGTHVTLAALTVIAGIGFLSSLLANVPVAAASVVMIKGYLVAAEVVPETALSAHFCALASGVDPGVCRDDVRCDIRGQRDADRRIREHRCGGRHLRPTGQADHVRAIPAPWATHCAVSAGGVGAVRRRAFAI